MLRARACCAYARARAPACARAGDDDTVRLQRTESTVRLSHWRHTVTARLPHLSQCDKRTVTRRADARMWCANRHICAPQSRTVRLSHLSQGDKRTVTRRADGLTTVKPAGRPDQVPSPLEAFLEMVPLGRVGPGDGPAEAPAIPRHRLQVQTRTGSAAPRAGAQRRTVKGRSNRVLALLLLGTSGRQYCQASDGGEGEPGEWGGTPNLKVLCLAQRGPHNAGDSLSASLIG